MNYVGNNTFQMYQLIGMINDEKNRFGIIIKLYEHLFSKDDPAINEHQYHITTKQYNEETHNIYNIDKTKTYHIKNNRYTDEHITI